MNGNDSDNLDKEKYLIAYFGRQSVYYLDKYKRYHAGHRFTFNIAAFLAGLFWFIYRKMYLYVVLIILAVFILGAIEGIVYYLFSIGDEGNILVYLIRTIFYATIFGFIGNYLYIRNTDKNIDKILRSTEDEEERIRLCKKKGGVTWIPFLILLAIILVVAVINNARML